jgi:Fe-S cluster biogenesis protein NfuA
MSAKDIEKALDGLRQGFQADGADLKVESATESQLTLRLVGGDKTCWECIIPPDQLREVIGSVLQDSVPSIETIDLIDPRAGG